MSGSVHLGAYVLTVVQSAAWHSADERERETVREEILRACRQRLRLSVQTSMLVRDVDGCELERVALD